MTEREKISKYASTGDLKLLGEVYEQYMHLVLGICMKYLKNEEDAQDAVMLIFEKLIVELRKHEVSNFKSWLAVLSRNFCLMQLRKTGQHQNSSLDDVEFRISVHHEEEDELDETALEECLENLPDIQKQCIQLFYFKELCYSDITESLKIELKKVKSAIQNGRRNLKICLEKRVENI